MVAKIKQLNTLDDKVAQGSDSVVLPNNMAMIKRSKLPNPPPINTNR